MDIAGYTRSAGSYIVGAYMPTGSDLGAALTSYTTASEVIFGQNLFLYGSGFTMPTDHWAGYDGGNFGANFRFSAATEAVPVPSPFLLLGIGLVAIGVARRTLMA